MPTDHFPPPLKPGDTIGVMAPSSYIAQEHIDASKAFLEARGYKVFIHPQTTARLHQSAGTPAQKCAALHDLVRDPSIKAVFFATGGNRALHMLDGLDYDLIAANPKIYMGFSDNTALLNAIAARSGVVTYHGPTFKRLPHNPQADTNLKLLAGDVREISLPGATVFREGTAGGILFGGNLALLRAMGSHDMPQAGGAILFLEDINIESSHLDRELCALRRSGMLALLGGLILGQFGDLLDTGVHPFGFSFEDIVAEHTAGLDIPILINAPFGHGDSLFALPVGARCTLDGTRLLFP